jgi:hypothetical protein
VTGIIQYIDRPNIYTHITCTCLRFIEDLNIEPVPYER